MEQFVQDLVSPPQHHDGGLCVRVFKNVVSLGVSTCALFPLKVGRRCPQTEIKPILPLPVVVSRHSVQGVGVPILLYTNSPLLCSTVLVPFSSPSRHEQQ